MEISSKSFTHGSRIPSRHTCDGLDVSPELQWTEPLDNALTFALVADDPDAPGGTFVHWVVYNIGGNRRVLEEGRLPEECLQGVNDFGNLAYSGPCPPRGKPHSYHFKLYALSTKLNLKKGPTRVDVEKAMQGHVIESTELVGQYGR